MHKQAKDSLEETDATRDDRRNGRQLSGRRMLGLQPDSPLLLKQAVWCGCVFSLAALIAVLNCLPPVDVYFQVRAQVVASPQRIAALKDQLRSDRSRLSIERRDSLHRESIQEYVDSGARIYSLAVLDQTRKLPLAERSVGDNVKLVEIHSRWFERTSPTAVRKWLEQITYVSKAPAGDSPVSHRFRDTHWQADAAEHYLAHHRHTSMADEPSPGDNQPLPAAEKEFSSPATLAAKSAKNRLRLVGTITSATAADSSGTNARDEDQIRERLEENLAQARAEFAQAAKDREQLLASTAGMLMVSGSPDIRAEAGSMPMWMASSVLVFALASGSCAGWLQHRLQSGGAFEPETVAALLAADGLDLVDRVNLSNTSGGASDWIEATGRRATRLSRHAACGMTSISEWIVMILGGGIATRFAIDPLWRDVFIDSPLAALGRLIVGLP